MASKKKQVATAANEAPPTGDAAFAARVINDAGGARDVPVDDLHEHPQNPRVGDVEAVMASIRANGFYGTLVVQASTMRVLAGNHRLRAAKRCGLASVPCVVVDVDDAAALRILLADNRTGDLASYDDARLAEALATLDLAGGVAGSGYGADDLASLQRRLAFPAVGGAVARAPRRRPGDDPPPFSVMCDRMQDALAAMPAASVDAIVTDPPYEIGFMGRVWDRSGVAFDPATWAACLRVLKPGGHLVAFGGARTWHRIAVAIEDAGFEVRDTLCWLFGTGFPKSLDVGRAIDDRAGVDRPIRGVASSSNAPSGIVQVGQGPRVVFDHVRTGPATDDAAAWDGWGTALKPAHEPIILARKPLDGTVAGNVLAHGVGGLDVAGARVVPDARHNPSGATGLYGVALNGSVRGTWGDEEVGRPAVGRWPSNVVMDDAAAATFDALHPDTPRFFYSAKASTDERDAGLDAFPAAGVDEMVLRDVDSAGANHPRAGAGRSGVGAQGTDARGNPVGRRNIHPTVKPVALMRWLVRLVTPPGGLVLDPFCGSGSTLCAAVVEGVRSVGVDLDTRHAAISHARATFWSTLDPAGLEP